MTTSKVTPEEKLSLQERTRAKLSEPDLLTDICASIANGGCVTDLCAIWQVRYSDVILWIHDEKADPRRKVAYEAAMKARGEWMIQTILKELRMIGTVDIRRAYDAAGALLPIQDIPEDVAKVITGIEAKELWDRVEDENAPGGTRMEKTGELVKVKFLDKIKAIELLGKNMAIWIDRTQHELGESLEDIIAGSHKVVESEPAGQVVEIKAEPEAAPAKIEALERKLTGVDVARLGDDATILPQPPDVKPKDLQI